MFPWSLKIALVAREIGGRGAVFAAARPSTLPVGGPAATALSYL